MLEVLDVTAVIGRFTALDFYDATVYIINSFNFYVHGGS